LQGYLKETLGSNRSIGSNIVAHIQEEETPLKKGVFDGF
jgi:hypothetical protein